MIWKIILIKITITIIIQVQLLLILIKKKINIIIITIVKKIINIYIQKHIEGDITKKLKTIIIDGVHKYNKTFPLLLHVKDIQINGILNQFDSIIKEILE